VSATTRTNDSCGGEDNTYLEDLSAIFDVEYDQYFELQEVAFDLF